MGGLQDGESRSYDGRTGNGVGTMRCKGRWAEFGGVFCLLMAWLLLGCARSGAQIARPSPSMPPPIGGEGREAEDSVHREMMEKLEKRRNDVRQEQLVKDTNKLLALATELKSQVDKTSKNVLSVDVVKKAEEIEKLAKNVKDRMRD